MRDHSEVYMDELEMIYIRQPYDEDGERPTDGERFYLSIKDFLGDGGKILDPITDYFETSDFFYFGFY